MTATTAGYRTSHFKFPSGMYSPSINEVDRMLPKDVKPAQSTVPMPWLSGSPQQAINTGDNNDYFGFDAPNKPSLSIPSRFPSALDQDLTPGWSLINNQVPSPPDSAVSPRSTWPQTQAEQRPTTNILSDIYPESRMQYGQDTPPDNDFPNLFDSIDLATSAQPPARVLSKSSPINGMKRKSNSVLSETKPPNKRGRKAGGDSKSGNAVQTSSAKQTNADDSRRSKFLERNRVAASKCREKKKAWTQNLEEKARNLQKENSSLRLMLDSLRDEMIFLKDEMLKHNNCGCERIEAFLQSSINSFNRSPLLKLERSLARSPSADCQDSVNVVDSGEPKANDGLPSPKSPEISDGSDHHKDLEALLINQLARNTSNQGIDRLIHITSQ
ncbi:MAG: hypothetical protein Q9214_000804 [Letrouitia sp. 1 TL-2023]